MPTIEDISARNKPCRAGVQWGMRKPNAAAFVLAALCACVARAQGMGELRLDFERELGPFSALRFPVAEVRPGERRPKPELDTGGNGRASRGALCFAFDRKAGVVDILASGLDISGMKTVEFDLKCSARSWLALGVEDLDGAKFHYIFEVAANTWRHVELRPADFKLSDDSPVKKDALDPAKLKPGFGLFDVWFFTKLPEGPNTIWLDNVRVLRTPLPVRKGGWTVTGQTELTESVRIEGELVLAKNAKLTVKAPRVELAGKVRVQEGAVLRFEKSVLCVPGSYPYEFGALIEKGGRLETIDTKIVLPVPWGVMLQEGSAWEARRTDFPSHNLTGVALPGSDVLFEAVETPGEFVLWPKAKTVFIGCRGLLLWMHAAAGTTSEFIVPGATVQEWSAPQPSGLNVLVAGCREIMWALVPGDGCNVTAHNGQLRAIGLFFEGDATRTVKALAAGKTYGAEPLKISRMTLDLKDSAVQTWNLYAREKAVVNIEDSTLGEVLSYDEAKVELKNSVCDGSGGYFGARGKSQLTAQKKCRFTCKVIAHDEAQITLTDCEIEGDVIAADKAKVTLIRCKVRGNKSRAPGALLDER